MAYIDDLNALKQYLSTGPSLDSQADTVILLYKVLSNLDKLDDLSNLGSILSLLQTINNNVDSLTTNGLDRIEEALLYALQNIPSTTTVYVSTGGDDDNSGNKLAPVRTIEVAIQKAAALNPTLTNPIQIRLATGTYVVQAPLTLPRDISLVGDAVNTVYVKPSVETEENNIILIDSNSTISNITFSGHQNGAFAIAFNNQANNVILGANSQGAYVVRPCLINNCRSLTSSSGEVIEGLLVNSDLSGGAIEVDGNKCATNSPSKTILVNSFNSTNYNGLGYLALNNGELHLNKCISNYAQYHAKCTLGGKIIATNNVFNYGNYGLIADGYNLTSQGSAIAEGNISQKEVTLTNLSAGAKISKGTLLKVGTDTYIIQSLENSANGFIATLTTPLLSTLSFSNVTLHRVSTIISNGQFLNHIGSGTDYSALAENNTVLIEENQLVELNKGKIICTSLNSNGDINLNKSITIDGTTGDVTISNTSILGLDNLEANFRLDDETNEVTKNITNTPDGVVPIPFSVDPYNYTNEQLQALSERLIGGSTYQLYVDVDNPNASDSKDNRGNTNIRPFRSLERALIEAARRSIKKGNNNDIYNRVSIHVAPGIYHLNNGKGGITNNEFYNRYQDAANLILNNIDYIIDTSFGSFIFTEDDDDILKSSLRSELLKVINYLTDDLSSLGNRQIVNLARNYVRTGAPSPGELGFNLSTFLNDFYANLILDNNGAVRDNSLLSGLINGIYSIRNNSISAMRNELEGKDLSITVDSNEPTCANVAATITTLTDILVNTLAGNITPYDIQINVGNTLLAFPLEEEPTDEILQSFNDPITPGIILPRGVSIIGADLRKVIFKPKYVPDPFDVAVSRCSIFRMTGGNFFQGFTVLDQDAQFRDNDPPFSHHKLAAFSFCTLADLDLYYNVVTVAFSDRYIYNKAQDAANLLQKNYNWLINKIPLKTYPLDKTRQVEIFKSQLPYFIQAFIYDLRRLGKRGVINFASRFKLRHIDTLEEQLKTEIVNFYKLQIDTSFEFLVQAINNLANTNEGGVRDLRIILDTSAEGQCADVVSAIYNYLEICKAVIDDSYTPQDYELDDDLLAQADSEPIDNETSIVIPSNSSSVDTVQGASPYIFSASVRSEYGMCGIDGDGNLVSGLKSYLAAQFTIISLQKDDRVFTTKGAEIEVIARRYQGSKLTDTTDPELTEARHFGYRVQNGAYAQLVSCFCICPAVHYWASNGAEFSITNSTSNFGDISLFSEGYLPSTYPQDRQANLIGIVKPTYLEYIDTANSQFADNFILGNIQSLTDLGGNIRKITLSSAAQNLDRFKIDNEGREEGEPDRTSYVYLSSATLTERKALVLSVETINNKTEITVDISGGGVWTTDVNSTQDATVIGKQLYIKRFVDTRSAINREYRLLVKRDLPLVGTRKPVIHYVIQKYIAPSSPETQPFVYELGETRTVFYVLRVVNTTLLAETGEQCYEIRIATLNSNLLGEVEYELDLEENSKIDLDYDPSDPLLADVLNKNTYSRQNMEIFLSLLGINDVDLDLTSNRLVDLRDREIDLNFNKPSIIRCGGQTWEYMGYYNYSSGLPFAQTKKLGEGIANDTLVKLLRVSKTQTSILGGRVYATGMDEEGNSYVGNTYLDLKTGESEEIIRGSSPEVLSALEEEEIPPTTTFNNVQIDGDLTVAGEYFNLPIASEERAGIAQVATEAEVIAEENNSKFITPAKLKKWRVVNKLLTNRTEVNVVYVSNNGFHSSATNLRSIDPEHGNSVSYSEYVANQENEDETTFWQLSNPAAPNFRCLGSMADVAAYGNANFSTNDQLILIIDPGKYRADYTYNFGININGANGKGSSGWGNPDGSDITEDGQNGGVILYVTTSVSYDGSFGIKVRGTSMMFNSTTTTTLRFVHIWSHVTAAKDPDTEWHIKAKEESTYEEMLLRANDTYYANNTSGRVNLRAQYNSHWGGVNRCSQVIRLFGTGTKEFAYCTFSGQGCSVSSADRGGNYGYGYIAVYESCGLTIRNVVLRGNEEIRFSDKHGRYVTTAVNSTPVLIPPEGYRTPDKWTWAPIYNDNGTINYSNVFGSYHTKGCFHDPFTEEWVSIGFCDFFIGIGEGKKVDIRLQGNSFSTNLTYFGYNEDVPYNSDDGRLDGVFTINNDLHNIRLEKNTGKLYGLEDDRILSKETSVGKTGDRQLYFKGTDNLGRKIKELHPPLLTFTNGVVNTNNQAAWTNWVDDLKNQGPMIIMFMRSRLPYTFSAGGAYSIWSDRDSSGLIRGQGFLGEFGYLPRISNGKLLKIQSDDFSGNTYGRTINWSQNGVGCKIICDNQYHYNFFRPAWKGFTLGKYQHPVIIDIGSSFTTLMNDLAANNNDYSIAASYIENDGYTVNGEFKQIHTLDGQIVGAMFYIVGTSASQLLSLMYVGYDYESEGSTSVQKKHKFILINTNVGVDEYFSAKTASNVFNTVQEMLGANLSVVTNTQVYIKESNLFLARTVVNGIDNGSDDLRSWTPVPLSPNYEIMHNLANMGLLGQLYKRGLFTDHIGYEINTQTDYNTLSSLPDHPQLRAGYYANTEFKGLEVMITTNENIIL